MRKGNLDTSDEAGGMNEWLGDQAVDLHLLVDGADVERPLIGCRLKRANHFQRIMKCSSTSAGSQLVGRDPTNGGHEGHH